MKHIFSFVSVFSYR